MKSPLLQKVLIASLTIALSGAALANPSIRARGEPEEATQSTAPADIAMSQNVSHIISHDTTLSATRGEISVATGDEHVIYLRGTVTKDEDHDKIKAALENHIGANRVEDDLMTVGSSAQ